MSFDIDSGIFIAFLLITLGVAIRYGHSIKTIDEYALGGRNFSNTALVSTTVATWISGSMFFIDLSSTYSEGLSYFIPSICMSLQLLITAYYFVPRMGEFLGSLSVAEVMGNLYGEKVRLITAICGIIANIGGIAVQFKVFGTLFNYFLGIPSEYALLLASVIVIAYSAFGGIKAVTYTDIVQFFTFSFVIPVIGVVIWTRFVSLDLPQINIFQDPLWDYKKVFTLENPKLLEMILLMMYFTFPTIGPMEFQRISIGRNVQQARKALIISGVLVMLITIFIAWIPLVIYNINPNLEANNLLSYIIDNYTYTGFKGLIIIGISAMAMSTADSRINAASVLFAHDISGLFKTKINALVISKIFAITLGVFSIYLALSSTSLLGIVMMSASFYMPIVSIPFTLSILGFRSSKKAVLIGMTSGFISTLLWDYLGTGLHKIIPSMAINLIFLIGSHYLLRQAGGWVGIKDTSYLELQINQKTQQRKELINYIKNFNLLKFCISNAPKTESINTFFGVFCFISTMGYIYSTSKNSVGAVNNYADIKLFLYQTLLVISSFFMLYLVWSSKIKNDKFVAVLWNISLVYVLCFCSTFFLIITEFQDLQLAVFTLNITVLFILTRWKVALVMLIIGIIGAIQLANYYMIGEINHYNVFHSNYSNVIYILLLVSTAFITVFKTHQEICISVEQRSDYLAHKLDDQKTELRKSLELKQEFLRNLEHEARTPITGISSMGQVLWDNYDKLSEQQRRQGVKDIAKSSERLNSLVSNILNLSKLSGLNYQLNIEDINFSELVYERVKICKKLYTEDKYKDLQEVTLDISDNIIVSCDKDYITTAIDNIVINALQYCTDGKITIIFYKNEQKEVTFKVQDEGIGIPKEELYDVFGDFTVSSKTKTPAGGRGVGLALCKKVIDLHNGSIWAKQNSDKGVTVGFNLPLKN